LFADVFITGGLALSQLSLSLAPLIDSELGRI
jgi:hypothetical protein